jgi:hypothetical protein
MSTTLENRKAGYWLTSINLARLAFVLHNVLVASEDHNCRQTTDETAPTLVREDVRKHSATLTEVSTIGGDSG